MWMENGVQLSLVSHYRSETEYNVLQLLYLKTSTHYVLFEKSKWM